MPFSKDEPKSAPRDAAPENPAPAGVAVRSGPAPQQPQAAPRDAAPEPDPNSPYTGPSEIVEGGRYRTGTRLRAGKHYGGRIVNGRGETLATFEDDQENTGVVEAGTKPEPNQG